MDCFGLAGIGETVLVNREGKGARQALKNPAAARLGYSVLMNLDIFLSDNVIWQLLFSFRKTNKITTIIDASRWRVSHLLLKRKYLEP